MSNFSEQNRNRSHRVAPDRTTMMGRIDRRSAQNVQRSPRFDQGAHGQPYSRSGFQQGSYPAQGDSYHAYGSQPYNQSNRNVTFDYSGQDDYAGFNSAYNGAQSKTSRKASKAIIVFVGFIFVIIAGIALVMLWPSDSGDAESSNVPAGQDAAADESFFEGMKNGAINYIIDASGAKDKVESALLQSQTAIREHTGMSSEEFAVAMDGLAIQEWQATTLPENSVPVSTVDLGALGVDASVTTYEDPSYVTVDFLGQEVTMEVPESAQPYMPLLGYLA